MPKGASDPIYVLALGNRRFAALSPICTHLGCTVEIEQSRLVCPCHGSTYDREGKVAAWPGRAGARELPHGGDVGRRAGHRARRRSAMPNVTTGLGTLRRVVAACVCAAALGTASPALGQRDTTARDTLERPFVRGGVYDKPYLTRLGRPDDDRRLCGGARPMGAGGRAARRGGLRGEAIQPVHERARERLRPHRRGARVRGRRRGDQARVRGDRPAHPSLPHAARRDAAVAVRQVQPVARQSAERVHGSAARLHRAAGRGAVGAGLRRVRAVRARHAPGGSRTSSTRRTGFTTA